MFIKILNIRCVNKLSLEIHIIPWSLNFIFTSILSLLIKYIFTQSLDLDHKTKSKYFSLKLWHPIELKNNNTLF